MSSASERTSLLVTGGRALARALRWLGLAAAVGALVYLVRVGHGVTGLTTFPAMASVAAILGLLLAAGATYLFSSTRPRNRILRASSPALVLTGVVVWFTGSPEASARRYFELHRGDLEGIARELQAERPFQGPLRDAEPFPGRALLRSRLDDLGIRGVRLDGARTVFVFPLDMDSFHGFMHVETDGLPPTEGEAFLPDVEYRSYRGVRALEGSWFYYRVVDLPATAPAVGTPESEPEPGSEPGAAEESRGGAGPVGAP